MRRKAFVAVAVLGIFAGGVVLGQAFSGADFLSIDTASDAGQKQLLDTAARVTGDYADTVRFANGAAQVTQAANEASIRLQYIQIKQNAEIIRLLSQKNGK